MAEFRNKQTFQELEYVFDRYYRENIAPIVKNNYTILRRNQEEETQRRYDDGWGGFVDAASPFTLSKVRKDAGPWNDKTSDDLFKMIDAQLSKDKNIQKDFLVMIEHWKVAAVKELGVDRYKELSSKCPSKDLAVEFVSNRFFQLELEQLAKLKAPRSSLEYILSKGIGGSLPGFLSSSLATGEHDSHIQELSEKLYNAGTGEKVGAYTTSFIVDTVSIGGYKSLPAAGKWLGLDFLLNEGVSYSEDTTTLDQKLGDLLYGDDMVFSDIRSSGKKVNVAQSYYIQCLNEELYRPMTIPAYRPAYSPSWELERYHEILNAAGDASNHFKNVVSVMELYDMHPKSDHSVPKWMLQKDQQECVKLSSSFLATALAMERSKVSSQTVSGKKLTYDEIVQKAYDYARAAAELYQREVSQKNAAVQAAAAQPSPQQQFVAQQPVNYQQTGMNGWHSFMDQFGLSGMSDIGQNLGYVIGMLPDMLISMLTGRSESLHLKDNLLPFGAIFAGLFVKNPLLKMLLIGLGGANIFNKAGHEILEKSGVENQQLSRRYVTHVDEDLSERIENPVMKGNALLATIDHKPCVIYIDETSADAYYQGKLPLNVLCNAVLDKYDAQQAVVRKNYDRSLSQDQEQQRTIGIK